MSSYQVLARKWRPTKFSDVKGQDHIIRTLKNSILNNRVASAYLFSGTRGVGKTSVARLLAKALCCTNSKDAEPCNECRNCVEITNSSSMDVQEIDGASNNSVDSIRDIRDNIIYPPVSSKYKIYIIDEVHMLSTSAFNALLKTLEEPPAHGLFILATTEVSKLPQTIVSRCQAFDFKKVTVDAITQMLKETITKENITASDTALYAVAREARGSLRDALSMLDKVISFAGNDLNDASVAGILGFVNRNAIMSLVRNILENKPKETLTLGRKLFEEGYDVKTVSDTIVEMFRNLLFIKNNLSEMLYGELPDYEIKELNEMSKPVTATDIEQWFYMANACAEETLRSAYPWIILEVGLLSMCSKPANSSINELINELKKLPASNVVVEKKKLIPEPTSTPKTFDWQYLVAKIGETNTTLHEILSKAKFKGLKDGKTILLDYSDSPELLGVNSDFFCNVGDVIYELYGTIYKIEVVNSAIMQKVADNESRKKILMQKEIVQDAIKIFEAKIDKVKLF